MFKCVAHSAGAHQLLPRCAVPCVYGSYLRINRLLSIGYPTPTARPGAPYGLRRVRSIRATPDGTCAAQWQCRRSLNRAQTSRSTLVGRRAYSSYLPSCIGCIPPTRLTNAPEPYASAYVVTSAARPNTAHRLRAATSWRRDFAPLHLGTGPQTHEPPSEVGFVREKGALQITHAGRSEGSTAAEALGATHRALDGRLRTVGE